MLTKPHYWCYTITTLKTSSINLFRFALKANEILKKNNNILQLKLKNGKNIQFNNCLLYSYYYAKQKHKFYETYMLSGCKLIDTENISMPSQNMKFVVE